MGSQSDWKVLCHSEKIIKEFKVSYEKKIISAHRTPTGFTITQNPLDKGIEVIIAGAGGTPSSGMVADSPPTGIWCTIESKSLKVWIAYYPSYKCQLAFQFQLLQ